MSVWIVGIRMIFGRGSPGEEWLCAQKALWGNLANKYRAVLKKCGLFNVFGALAVPGH